MKNSVTPRAGVWIEIGIANSMDALLKSLPVRECGLKCRVLHSLSSLLAVTPRAGVWIEMELARVILSRLVDTFSSRILYPMLLLSGNHSIAAVLSWEEGLH